MPFLLCGLLVLCILADFWTGFAEDVGKEISKDEPRRESTAPPAAPAPLPAFQNIRYAERWNALTATAASSHYRRVKYIPLENSGLIYLSIGGQLRLRSETWRSFAFRQGADDTYALSRLGLHTDLYVGAHVRLFIEGQVPYGGAIRVFSHPLETPRWCAG